MKAGRMVHLTEERRKACTEITCTSSVVTALTLFLGLPTIHHKLNSGRPGNKSMLKTGTGEDLEMRLPQH